MRTPALLAALALLCIPSPPLAPPAAAETVAGMRQALQSRGIAEPATAIGRVTAEHRLNVRRLPWGEIIDGLAPGARVEILHRRGEWYLIRHGDGTAFVHTSLVEIASGSPLSLPILADGGEGANATVTASVRLNVRRSPEGEVIDGLRPGARVEILGREGDWCRIRYGGGVACVYAALVKADGGTPGATATTPKTPGATPGDPGATVTPPAAPPAGGINGPDIPAALLDGLAAAKKSEWFRSHKCLQFAGTVANKAGAHLPAGKTASQPQSAYPPDTALRGAQINDLPQAVSEGKLLPGMLIHVKIHYDKDPAYHRADDAHHWFVYMGTRNGVPMFADNTHGGNLQTADEVHRNMKGWRNSRTYGDAAYGYVPRVTAVHDPFADRR